MRLLSPGQARRFAQLIAPLNTALAAHGEPLLGEHLLTERAGLLGFTPTRRQSANGACRLIRARDGWIALNLAREEDAELIPALLERGITGDPWAAVENAAKSKRAATLVARATLLGLPLSRLGEARRLPAVRVAPLGNPRPIRQAPLVVDLSSLWAGPLASQVLARLGADVVRVESASRRDGDGPGRPFFQKLEAGKHTRRIDFRNPAGRTELEALLAEAAVVIEASRPRALQQLGIDPARIAAHRPGLIWVRLTAYGAAQPLRTGFGDDAAVAGGLVTCDAEGAPQFLGDAMADPLAGLVAARAILAAQKAGGGAMIEVALAGAAAAMARAA